MAIDIVVFNTCNRRLQATICLLHDIIMRCVTSGLMQTLSAFRSSYEFVAVGEHQLEDSRWPNADDARV